MANHFLNDEIRLGVCYYPEAWSQNEWEQDLKTMREYGIQYVRIAEFAWTSFEPQEGVFCFDLFDHFLDLCVKHHMNVVFCTPTAIPPVWMSEKYPEILNADLYGHQYHHGFRRHCNYSSQRYFDLSRRIVEQLAIHFGKRKEIIGWQIDNEFNCENNLYHSEADHEAFRKYCYEKYGSLDALNQAWGSIFWNQTYTDWSQVFLPRLTVVSTTNPHLLLEEKYFISHQIRKYCKMQADVLRHHVHPGCFITHNGIFDNLDSHRLTQESLDFIAYDSYPNFAFIGSRGIEASVLGEDATTGDTGLFDRKWSRNLSMVRSISPHFMITEQQCGPGGSYGRISQCTPRCGQMRLWTFQSIAHGANLVSYFRWRTTPVGSEMYWHGLYLYNNKTKTPRFKELKKIGDEVAKLSCLAGTFYAANVALVRNYPSDWDAANDNWSGPVGRSSENAWVTALQYSHVPFDYLYLDNASQESLNRYQALIISRTAILTAHMAKQLEKYVEQGGTVIVGPRCGYKDQHGRCYSLDLPGCLGNLLGVYVEDFTLVNEFYEKQFIEMDGDALAVPDYYDVLKPMYDDVQIVGRYQTGDHAGRPAVTQRHVGAGWVWYYGATMSQQAAVRLIERLGIEQAASHLFGLPQEIELVVRRGENAVYFILLNYQEHSVSYTVKARLEEILLNVFVYGEDQLEKYGVRIYRAPLNCPV